MFMVALVAGCGSQDQSDVADDPYEGDVYGEAKLAGTFYGGNAETSDIAVTMNYGGGFIVMRYWASVQTVQAGSGYALTADCLDENGATSFGDGGIGDGSALSSLQGQFVFNKDPNSDCHFYIDLVGVPGIELDWQLDIGNPN